MTEELGLTLLAALIMLVALDAWCYLEADDIWASRPGAACPVWRTWPMGGVGWYLLLRLRR